MNNIDIPIYGNGLNIRDWIYVDDHTQAIIELHKKDIVADRFNIGGDNEITNLDLVENIIEILKTKYNINPKIKFVEDRKGHDRRYAIDMKKTNALLGDLPRNDWTIAHKVFEAGYFGKPLISSQSSALEEVFTEGKDILFYSPSQSLSELITDLVEMDNLSNLLGTDIKLTYNRKISQQMIGQSFINVIKPLFKANS